MRSGCLGIGRGDTSSRLCPTWVFRDTEENKEDTLRKLDGEWQPGLWKLLQISWAYKDKPSETVTRWLDGSLGSGTTYSEGSLCKEMRLDQDRNPCKIQGFSQWDGMEGLFWPHLWLHPLSFSVKLCNWIEYRFEWKRIWSPNSIGICEILWIWKKKCILIHSPFFFFKYCCYFIFLLFYEEVDNINCIPEINSPSIPHGKAGHCTFWLVFICFSRSTRSFRHV